MNTEELRKKWQTEKFTPDNYDKIDDSYLSEFAGDVAKTIEEAPTGGGNLSPNRSKSLLKAYRYLTTAEIKANGNFGEAFDQLDYNTCCISTRIRVEFYQPDPAQPVKYGQWLVAVWDSKGYANRDKWVYVDGSFRTSDKTPAKFVPEDSPEAKYGYVRRDTSPASITDWTLGELSIWSLNGADQFATAKQAGGTFPAFTGVDDAYWTPAAAPVLPASNLLTTDNIWTGVNTYQTDFKLGRPYSNQTITVQWYGTGIGFYDVDNDAYSTVDAADYYAFNAPYYYTSYTDFANAFQELATTPGSRIQWVQGGLRDYNAFGAYRGSITRPHRSMQEAHDAARDGDVICVLPGGTGVDALGRPYYTENYVQTKNVRLKLLPGAIVGGEILFGAYQGDKPLDYVFEGGGTCLGLVALCRQTSGRSTLTVRNIRLEELGTFQYVANNYPANAHLDEYIMEDCRVDSKRAGGTNGPIRNNSRTEYGQCRMVVRNTPIYTLDAPCITFSAFVPGSVVLEGPLTQLFPGGGRDAYESKNTGQGAPTTPQSDWLVDNRPNGGQAGPGSYTDEQARAAQLGRTAPAGTTTVTLTAEAPTDYGTIASGSFTIDATGCLVGKCVRFAVAAGGQAPAFSNAPAGQPYKYLGASYASGKAFSYSLLVGVDRIEVVTLAD